jgi:hypothetical protein
MDKDTRPLLLDLVADDGEFRSLAETDWVTLRGKHNRLAIGSPFCEKVQSLKGRGLLTDEHLRAFPLTGHDFYQLSLSLTLVPDTACLFRSVDFVMELASAAGQNNLPIFARLEPREEVSKEAVKLSSSDSAKLGVKDNTFELVTAELGSSSNAERQFEKIQVHLGSFGVNTRSGGWRYKLTKSKEIPLSSNGLKALVVVPKGEGGQINFKVAAQIEIKTAVDRILTKLFLRQSPASASADYEFP